MDWMNRVPEGASLFEASIPRGEGFRVRLVLREANEWHPSPHVDLRLWSVWKNGGGGAATRKGFAIPIGDATALREALTVVIDEARARGVLEGGGDDHGR